MSRDLSKQITIKLESLICEMNTNRMEKGKEHKLDTMRYVRSVDKHVSHSTPLHFVDNTVKIAAANKFGGQHKIYFVFSLIGL